MRCLFKRELYQNGRILHDQNYESSLTIIGEKCLHNLSKGRSHLRSEDVVGVARRYCSTIMGFMMLVQVNKKDRQRRDHYEPLHKSLMEFTAALYLKSLSEKNKQEQLATEMENLFNSNSDSTENILTYAVEMLASDNACSDILTKIPKFSYKTITRPETVTVGGHQVIVVADTEKRSNIDQAARMRLLQTSGYTHQNIASVLMGLLDQQPIINCSQSEIQGWTKMLEFKSDLFKSISINWSPECGPLSHLGLDHLFDQVGKSSVRDISLDMNFSQLGSCGASVELEPCDQLRYISHLLHSVTQCVEQLTISVTDGVTIFPLVEALSHAVKLAGKLTKLELDFELSQSNLSMITSALQKCPNIAELRVHKSVNGSASFKHLQNLIKSGQLQTLHFQSVPLKHLIYTSRIELDDTDNCYIYEDEEMVSEDTKLRKLTPILKKIYQGASLQDKEVSPVEIVDGSLHPCVRYTNIYPAPICSNHKTGQHHICQALAYHKSRVSSLVLDIADPRDFLCLGDCLTTNSSLKSLTVTSRNSITEYFIKGIQFSFPLLCGLSCHLGITEIDFSKIDIVMDSEALQVALSAFSSNTALSLEKVTLSGWKFKCSISEKTNIMQQLIQYFKNSRISQLNLSKCQAEISCNQRQFALYFEIEEQDVARSLWNEIHEDKIVSSSLTHLNLRGFQMKINQKLMMVHQEISMIDACNLQYLDISKSEMIIENPPFTAMSLLVMMEPIQEAFSAFIKELKLDNYCLNQATKPHQLQDLKQCLQNLVKLETISFESCWFVMPQLSKEDILKTIVESCPLLNELSVRRCNISKDVGMGLARAIKTRVKNGSMFQINIEATSGEGVDKMISLLNNSKTVFTELNTKTNILTVQKL